MQEKAGSLPNVEIFTSSQTTRVTGDGEKVTGIRIKDRITNEERDYPLDGIFVQIGLATNSAPFRDALETTPTGEIKTERILPHHASGCLCSRRRVRRTLQTDCHSYG